MSDMLYKVHQCKVLDADKGKPIVAQVSTADVDADGDVIWQGPSDKGRGWLVDDFNKRGGRFYWMHNPLVPNLAKGKAWVDDNRLLVAVEFDMQDELAASLDRKVRGGYVDEWSVGFRPLKAEPRDTGGLDIFESQLFEVSVVNQGANHNTTVLSKSMADVADIVKMYEDRMRNMEAGIMRLHKMFTAQDEQKLRDYSETFDRFCTRV